MSERLPLQPGHPEALLPAGEVEKLLEATTERSPAELQAEAFERQSTLETARTTAETIERDDPLARLEAAESAPANQAPAPPPNSFLQKQSLQRELKSLQRKQSAPVKALSRLVHSPVIRQTSEAASKTVSRPSGLLGGGIVAFAGTSAYLYLAYYIGFTYQPTVFLVLLVVGFIIGIAVEYGLRLVTKSRA